MGGLKHPKSYQVLYHFLCELFGKTEWVHRLAWIFEVRDTYLVISLRAAHTF